MVTMDGKKKPKPNGDRYTQNPMGTDRVWDWFLKLRGFGTSMGLRCTRPNYPKHHTHLPEIYTRIFLFIFLFSLNSYLLVTYFSKLIM
ncbi:hypothetical protein Hanom_Chr03g00213431 [Helianthus anomalus]